MTEQADNAPQRKFMISVRRPWKLWIWPVLGLLYFIWVLLVMLVPLETGVDVDVWVFGGLGLFALLLFIELLLLPTKKVKQKKVKASRAAAAPVVQELEAEPELDAPLELPEEEAVPAAPLAPPPAAPAGTHADVAYVRTDQSHKGRTVLEVSVPPKSAHPGAVYSKAFVGVDEQLVLRVEDLVAEADEAR